MTTSRRRLGRSKAAGVPVLRGSSDERRFIHPVAQVPSFRQGPGQPICSRHYLALQLDAALPPTLVVPGLCPLLGSFPRNPAQQHRVGGHAEFPAASRSLLATTRGFSVPPRSVHSIARLDTAVAALARDRAHDQQRRTENDACDPDRRPDRD
jgi:hypothetical protein